MAELIDRNEILKVLTHRVKGNEDNFIVLGTNNTLSLVEEWVRSIQTVDAEEVAHGRWVYEPVEFTYEKDIKCSVCGVYVNYVSKYCPNCGAKMDGGKDND